MINTNQITNTRITLSIMTILLVILAVPLLITGYNTLQLTSSISIVIGLLYQIDKVKNQEQLNSGDKVLNFILGAGFGFTFVIQIISIINI